MTREQYCAVLCVRADASEKKIAESYRRLAFRFHPDHNPAGAERFKEVQAAYEYLKEHPQRKAREPMRRGAPMNRATKPMRPRSQKRAKQDRTTNDLEEFSSLFIGSGPGVGGAATLCWLCRDRWASEIHHICGRNSPRLRHHRCNLFAACAHCHEHILPVMGIPAVFAIKRLRDSQGWDRDIQNALIRSKGQGVGV